VIVIIIAFFGLAPITDFLGAVLSALGTVLSATVNVLRALLPIVGVFLLAGLITVVIVAMLQKIGRDVSLVDVVAIFTIALLFTTPRVAPSAASGSLGLVGRVLAALIALAGVMLRHKSLTLIRRGQAGRLRTGLELARA
jgi:hypothetical protein